MATVDRQGVVTMQELIASSLAQTNALTKLLIENGNLIGLYKIKLLSRSLEVPHRLAIMYWAMRKLLSLIHKNLTVTV